MESGRWPNGVGRKMFVATWSRIEWLIVDRSASAGDCVAKTRNALRLRYVLRPSCANAVNAGSASAFQNSSIAIRSEEHTSELQSLMRISYAVFCLKKKKTY